MTTYNFLSINSAENHCHKAAVCDRILTKLSEKCCYEFVLQCLGDVCTVFRCSLIVR